MVFDKYARYYDLLYQDKDYTGEAAYIAGLLEKYGHHPQSILELGCGTGKHAELLAEKGYRVHGLDQSAGMLAEARQRANEGGQYIQNRLQFTQADIRNFALEEQFDASIALFHVMSYQNTDTDVASVLGRVAKHLTAGGIFVFDTWYGPAVLCQQPELRVKRLADAACEVTRIAEPVLRENEDICEVHYDVFVKDKKEDEIHEFQELHSMRYFFAGEVRRLLKESGFTLVDAFEFMTGNELGRDTWGSCFVARKA